MTTRRWMIAVAVLALILGPSRLAVRRAAFVGRSRDHAAWLRVYRANLAAYESGRIQYRNATPEFIRGYDDVLQRKIRHHEGLKAKYDRATRYPWLPVESDPPEPE
jgi:hypothetical protein